MNLLKMPRLSAEPLLPERRILRANVGSEGTATVTNTMITGASAEITIRDIAVLRLAL